MLPYTMDDQIVEPLTGAVEVTIDFGGRGKRWCFFTTPQVLASVGDCVNGTQVRVHVGVNHMIIVSELTEEIIDRVLRQLYVEGQLEAHTTPLV